MPFRLWKLNKILPKHGFIGGVAALVGGAIGGQLIVIAASPVITRLYTPSMFGIFSVFLGLSAIFSVLATWRYEIAIPQAITEVDARALVALCTALSVGMFGLAMLAVLLLGSELKGVFQLNIKDGYLWFIPVYILITGIYQILNYWNYRKRKFGDVARSKIYKNLGMTIIQLAGYSLGSIALLIGQLIGQLVAGLYLIIKSEKIETTYPSLLTIKRNAIRFRKYPLFSTWSGILDSICTQTPILLLAALFSSVEAGLYALAFRVVSMPSSLIGTAITNVYLPHAADSYRDGSLGALLASIHGVLSRLALPPVAILVTIAPIVVPVIFGLQWRVTGLYVQMLGLMLYTGFIYSPISQTFGILNRQDAGLVFHICLLTSSVGGILLGAMVFHSVVLAILLYSLGNSLIYITGLCWLHKKLGNKYSDVFKPIFDSAVKSVPIILPIILWISLPIPNWLKPLLCLFSVVCFLRYYWPLYQSMKVRNI